MNNIENEEERLGAMSDLIPHVLKECCKTVKLIDILDVLNELGYLKGFKKIDKLDTVSDHNHCGYCHNCGYYTNDCVCSHNELLEKIENITEVKND